VDIAAWLRELGLERFEEAFRENEIDAEILSKLTADDLKDIGVTTVGHRRKLLEAIAVLAEPALAPQAGPSAPPQAVPRARSAEAERRQLTVLFCDLVGSTELSARLDPEDLRAVMGAYHRCTVAVIERFEGYLARYLGDGVLAYFGWPQAHEEDAERAVRAGLKLVEAVAQLEPYQKVRLQARVGIATGQVVVGDLVGEGVARDEAVVGATPNLAARLPTLAAPGSVVLSQATRRLIGGLFELDDLGPRRLKGFAEPLAAWRVKGEGRAEGRFEAMHGERLTPLVGREHELGILLERWAWAKDGDGQVLLLSGEPGIGKSRVIRTLRERLGDEPYTPLSHYCSPHHVNSALYPVVDLLHRGARLGRDDPPAQQLAKLETFLAESTDDLDEVVPLVAALLSIPTDRRYAALELSPERQKQRTLEVLADQLARLTSKRPVIAVFEDIHWIDPSTLELLELVIERVRRLPALVLITYRPEFTPPWTGRAHITLLPLNRLGRPQGAAMALRVAGCKRLPPEIVEQIVARTDGIPLFVEELTKTVLESGILTDVGDSYELTGSLPALAIPETLHDSLMARLDRSAPVKEIAQLGAVIGREFSQELLAAVADRTEDQLRSALDQLLRSELVFRRGSPPNAIYTFKHTMVQEVAYRSLLKSIRERFHARIARVLEQRFSEIAATEPELLALHYTAAGLHDQAVDYWHRAGQRASERSADLEAVAHLTKGLELARTLSDSTHAARQELKLLVALGEPLVAAKGPGAPEAGVTYTRAWELCRQIGETPHLFPTMWGLWHFNFCQGACQKARDVADELLGLAEQQDDPIFLVAAHQALGQSLYHMGKFTAARIHLEQARAGLDPKLAPAPHLHYAVAPGVHCIANLAQLLWCLGYPDQALQRNREAVRCAQELSHMHSLTHSMYFATRLHLLRGEARQADELAEAALALSTKHGFTLWTAWILFLQGWSLSLQGRGAEGIARMRAGLTDAEATGAKMMRPMFCSLLTEAYGQVGELDEAWRMLSAALDAVEEHGQRHFEAETYRFKGELHLLEASPDIEQASICFQRSLDIARLQQAKSWELRAAISLARLWRDQGRRAQASDLLAPVYGWFTEGFDTADLKEARGLLNELG
jgi:class 3 adenylate cyclase/predicted ATPase